jgi:hypothetical protein
MSGRPSNKNTAQTGVSQGKENDPRFSKNAKRINELHNQNAQINFFSLKLKLSYNHGGYRPPSLI